jgi:pimeloyl-ACP methyl ester carboxylesterase
MKLRRPAPAARYRNTLADPTTLERPEAAPLIEAAERGFRRTPTATMARAWRSAARTDLRSSAPGVRQPTLLLVGERDRIVHPAESGSLARVLPDATLVRIPDCGHLPHLERPEVALPAILRHLDALGDGYPEPT